MFTVTSIFRSHRLRDISDRLVLDLFNILLQKESYMSQKRVSHLRDIALQIQLMMHLLCANTAMHDEEEYLYRCQDQVKELELLLELYDDLSYINEGELYTLNGAIKIIKSYIEERIFKVKLSQIA